MSHGTPAGRENLESVLRRRGLLRPEEACRIAIQLADQLEGSHEQGRLHGEVSPQRVLVSTEGKARLNGGSAAASSASQPPEASAYMAPEQAAGNPSAMGPPTDVYGLGAVLYTMLTGEPPFSGSSVEELLDMVVIEAPRPPSQRLPTGLEASLDSICLRCLEKYPEKRFASARELSLALREHLGEPLPGPGTPARRMTQAVVVLGGALACGLVALAIPTAPPERSGSSPAALPEPPPPTHVAPERSARELELSARAEAADGRWPEAVGDLRAALALEPEQAGASVGLAWALDASGASSDAVADAVERALGLLPQGDPRRPRLVNLAGWLKVESLRERFAASLRGSDPLQDVILIAELGSGSPPDLERLHLALRDLRGAWTQRREAGESAVRAMGEAMGEAGLTTSRNFAAESCLVDAVLSGRPGLPVTLGLVGRQASRDTLSCWAIPGCVLLGDAEGREFWEPIGGRTISQVGLRELVERGGQAWRPELLRRLDRTQLLARLLATYRKLLEADGQWLRAAGALGFLLEIYPDEPSVLFSRAKLAATLGLDQQVLNGATRLLELRRWQGVSRSEVVELQAAARARARAHW